MFGKGVTKQHYTLSDRTRPSPNAAYSVRIARAVSEGFGRISAQGHAFVKTKNENKVILEAKSGGGHLVRSGKIDPGGVRASSDREGKA